MAERRKVIEQRVGHPKKLEGLSDGNYHFSNIKMALMIQIFNNR